MSAGLYIHIPFCASRCPYCDFAFVVGKTRLADRYVSAVIREFRTRLGQMHPRPAFETVYFGGGTPSAVSPDLLRRILDGVRKEATVPPGAEITVEANPTDRDGFAALREIGVNRLSLGIQALNDPDLKGLGRLHTAADAVAAFHTAHQAGFCSLNIDLIFGIPNQTLSVWQSTLDRAVALGPEHLSVYGLTVESGTAFDRRFRKGRLPLPPEGEQAAMYGAAQDRLAKAGYLHYEVSNFARPGFFSQHNLSTWQRRPYLGIGLSAHSFLDGRRSWNIRDLMAYIKNVESTGTAIEGTEELKAQEVFLERVMLGLRRSEGIPETWVENGRTAPRLNHLLSHRLLKRAEGRIRLTRRGFLLADLVCAELVKDA